MSLVAENTVNRPIATHTHGPNTLAEPVEKYHITHAMPAFAPLTHQRWWRAQSIAGAHRNFTVQARPSRLSKPMSARFTPCWRK